MYTLLLLTISIIPGIFLVYRYFSKDIYKKEPWAVVWKSFFWGAAMLIPAGILETSIKIPYPNSFWGMAAENFLLIALTEELCKFWVIRFYSYRNVSFDETMDGIVYGVAVASGFATFENIFYVTEHGMAVGLIRAVLSVPSHAFSGAILGYWLAKSKFQNISAWYASFIALSIVVITHGFFDFVLTYQKGSYFYLSIIPVILQAWLVKRYVKQALEYDAAYIHSPETVSAAINPNPDSAVRTGEVSDTAVENIHSHTTSYARSIVHVALKFLAIFCFLTAAFLMLGFVVNYIEEGEELWVLILPFTPFILGMFFLSKAKKMKLEFNQLSGKVS
jgi:RsiW-degrading membrane proteinase PrsW (M82 family)